MINLGVDASDYAGHLLAIIRATRTTSRWAPTVAMAQRSNLEQRFRALLGQRANRRGVTRWTALAVAAAALLLAWPLAALRRPDIDWNIDLYTNPPSIVSDAGVVAGRESAGSAVRAVRAVATPESSAAVSGPEMSEYTTPPLYSEEARTQRLEGIVTIAAHVEADGRVSETRLVRGLGAGLDQNATVAVRQWRFRPGTRAGAPIAMWAEIDVEFSLRNDAANALIANDMATRVGPGVTPPQAIRRFELWNRRAVKPGSIVLDFVLLEDGSPRIVRILKSLDPALDEGAMRNFERWRFSPAMKDGKPIKVRMNAEVRFK